MTSRKTYSPSKNIKHEGIDVLPPLTTTTTTTIIEPSHEQPVLISAKTLRNNRIDHYLTIVTANMNRLFGQSRTYILRIDENDNDLIPAIRDLLIGSHYNVQKRTIHYDEITDKKTCCLRITW